MASSTKPKTKDDGRPGAADSLESTRASGTHPKATGQRTGIGAARLCLLATAEDALVARFDACLPDDVRVLRLDDVFSLLEMMEGYAGDDLTLVIDERQGMLRPETIAALSGALPPRAQVLLWGIDGEALSRTEALAPARHFISVDASTTIEELGAMCRPDEAEGAPIAQSAKRLLLVDDDATFTRSFARLLATAGYDVTVSHDSRAALDLCRDGNFDAVLTDLQMPGMNGLSFAATLRLAMGDESPKILMITANASAVDDPMLDGLMHKPVAPTTVLSTLDALLLDEEPDE